MKILVAIMVICFIISIISDKKKTWIGIKKGMKMFINLLLVILYVIILISIVLFLLPGGIILRYLGKDAGFIGYVIAAFVDSVALIPGFIAYPQCKTLLKPKEGDCCIFCSYGDVPCPPVQKESYVEKD